MICLAAILVGRIGLDEIRRARITLEMGSTVSYFFIATDFFSCKSKGQGSYVGLFHTSCKPKIQKNKDGYSEITIILDAQSQIILQIEITDIVVFSLLFI